MIQLFKPVFAVDEVLEEIRECLEKGWTGNGYKTIEFENEFKLYTKVSNAIFLNSATSGLHLALEVIKRRLHDVSMIAATTPLTFIATNHAIKHAGLVADFIDVDEYLCMDPESLTSCIKKQKPLAVIFVGLAGSTGRLEEIAAICHDNQIPLIFDAAHCMGTYVNGKHVGTEADFTVFSFQSVKNLPTADSGMLVCRYGDDDKLARKLAWLGIDSSTYERAGNWDYNVSGIGWKYHGNSIMAAMGLVGLRYLNTECSIRRQEANVYIDSLNKDFYRIIQTPSLCHHARHLFQVRVDAKYRDPLISFAKEEGVQLGVHYKPSTEYTMYRNQQSFVPVATMIWKELVSLPIGSHLKKADIMKVIEVLNEFSTSI